MEAKRVKQELQALGQPHKAEHSKSFFKTGKGEYGEGDLFLGCTVPQSRSVAKRHKDLPLPELKKLLDDEYHECRFCALIILVAQFKRAKAGQREALIDFYLSNTDRVNNWDLVDTSAYQLLGEWLKDKDRSVLYRLASSESLWEQRISIVATMAFIRENDFTDTLQLSEIFLTHTHDLIHKACGWMLREVGNRDEKTLTNFLDQYAHQMPRTMLRYSIEKLTPEQRKYYMKRQ